MFSAVRIVTPRVHPVSFVDVVRDHLRVNHHYDDLLISGYLDAATSWAENYLDRTLTTTTLQWIVAEDQHAYPGMYGAGWSALSPYALPGSFHPLRPLELPRAPAQEILDVSIEFAHEPGSATAPDCTVDYGTEPARLWIRHPSYGAGVRHVRVTYKAGYGDDFADVPVTIRHAILLKTAWFYENRGDVDPGSEPRAIEDLLSQHRLISFGR